ncbi:trypsin-like peptidase domain-containing protein [Clostridium estertheticum]|uniref:trypsin-like peptidase domain-containing protein n=1 Tax=Clostridium estertheticum TaxID=238834 RepID=UPI001CF18FD6|nr:trypsin-like peptidase domain-containing protein [Clostridium estertheticum]MCB2353926.1 hypothetical protein [Clostridium estertheticum]WAG43067.1 hypothetical protein LL065_10455 [Clostridium estertheticum]
MKEIYNIEKYSIMIDCSGVKGSGVFMSSKSPEYDYIITAKHCLEIYKNTSDIIFTNNTFSTKHVFMHKTLDIAIIQIEKSNESSFFSFINIEELKDYKENIYIYGYPKILREDEIKYCKLECKYDAITDNLIRLRALEEISTFREPAIKLLEGMSGCPAYIEKDGVVIFIGIYYENSHKDFAFRHINVIPLDTIKDMIRNNNLEDLNLSFCSELISEDLDPLYINYDKLVRDDFRNLKDKIIDVSPTYNNNKIGFLSRKVGDTIFEIEKLPYQRKAALLYRVFLSANEKQLDLVAKNKEILTESEVDNWIDTYTDYAKEIIDDKSEEYKYRLKSRDIIKGIVLQLLDNCYISFDEVGSYYKEGDNNK